MTSFPGINNRIALRIRDHGMVDECIFSYEYDEYTCPLGVDQLENPTSTPISHRFLQPHASNETAESPIVAHCIQDPSKWFHALEQPLIVDDNLAGSVQCPYSAKRHNSV